MHDLRMAVSLPADEAKECRPGERAGARNTTSRYGLFSLLFQSSLTNVFLTFLVLLAKNNIS